ncbi:hypothetical protein [Luteimonas salinilitoris]|uniref:Type II secretion system protein n=1 Tax=Luteimonas salinilitoris TaxID=3237697 RepID=A0ABV4HP94_9GAMM
MSAGRWLLVAAGGVAIVAVVAAVAVMGTPAAQREAKLDNRRVHDLQRIADVVDHYYEQHDALPPDLAILAGQPGQRLAIADPVDGTPYGYEITGERGFRLCAAFTTDTADTRPGVRPWSSEWNHGAGLGCFDRRAGKGAGDGRKPLDDQPFGLL